MFRYLCYITLRGVRSQIDNLNNQNISKPKSISKPKPVDVISSTKHEQQQQILRKQYASIIDSKSPILEVPKPQIGFSVEETVTNRKIRRTGEKKDRSKRRFELSKRIRKLNDAAKQVARLINRVLSVRIDDVIEDIEKIIDVIEDVKEFDTAELERTLVVVDSDREKAQLLLEIVQRDLAKLHERFAQDLS